MSVSSILAFVLAGVAARSTKATLEVDVAGLKAEIVGLRRDLDDGRRALEVERHFTAALQDDIARANVQARRDQELIDIWRERALHQITDRGHSHGLQAPQPAGPDFRPPPGWAARQQQVGLAQYNYQQQNLGQAQFSQQQQAQQNQALAQNAQYAMQNQALAQQNQLLGAQTLIDAELWCNCVPSRSQVWATSDPE